MREEEKERETREKEEKERREREREERERKERERKREEEEKEKERRRENKKMEASTRYRNQGNSAFQRKDYDSALSLYSQALSLTPSDIRLYTNRSLAYLRLSSPRMSLYECQKAEEFIVKEEKEKEGEGRGREERAEKENCERKVYLYSSLSLVCLGEFEGAMCVLKRGRERLGEEMEGKLAKEMERVREMESELNRAEKEVEKKFFEGALSILDSHSLSSPCSSLCPSLPSLRIVLLRTRCLIGLGRMDEVLLEFTFTLDHF